MRDHVHMLLRIPPKYSMSQVVGYIKGKSAIHLARVGACQATCRFSMLLEGVQESGFRMVSTRVGLRWTVVLRDQSRVCLDHRLGCFWRARW